MNPHYLWNGSVRSLSNVALVMKSFPQLMPRLIHTRVQRKVSQCRSRVKRCAITTQETFPAFVVKSEHSGVEFTTTLVLLPDQSRYRACGFPLVLEPDS